MTLDEAIKHAEEVAEEKQLKAHNLKQCKDYGNPKSTITSGVSKCETCADEHRQLAEWLKDYKRLLEQEPILDKIREQIMSNLKGVDIALEVLAENHPLRQKMEGAKDTLVDCLELIDKAETEAEDGECK